MTIETENDLLALKLIGRIVAQTIQLMGRHLQPGISTAELDAIGAEFLQSMGAQSAPQLHYQFPGATCISVNEEAAHGVPGKRIIEAGDLVNIDVSAEKNGYYADSGYSFQVGNVSAIRRRVCESTQQALHSAMQVAKAGNRINLIGKRITQVARATGFVTLRDLGSHGVGRSLHEEPEFISNYYDSSDKRVLKEGQVITIEPFLSSRAQATSTAADGWTLLTPKGNVAAQYEHTMVITRGQPIILTAA